MKKIQSKDKKQGDWIYLEGIKDENRRFVIKIIEEENKKEKDNIDWWGLNHKLIGMFAFIGTEGKGCFMVGWDNYNLFKLNKKEIMDFKKRLILKNLK